MLLFGGVAAILWVGGQDVLAGRITAGELSAFVFYAAMVAGSVGAISEVIGDLQRGAGAAERLLEILHSKASIGAPAMPAALPLPALGTVQFEEVSFSYPTRPGQRALDRLTLDVRPGERV